MIWSLAWWQLEFILGCVGVILRLLGFCPIFELTLFLIVGLFWVCC